MSLFHGDREKYFDHCTVQPVDVFNMNLGLEVKTMRTRTRRSVSLHSMGERGLDFLIAYVGRPAGITGHGSWLGDREENDGLLDQTSDNVQVYVLITMPLDARCY